MDGMFIKASSKMNYLCAATDGRSNVTAIHLSERRDKQSAILCLRKAGWIAGMPDILVTDGWNAYQEQSGRCSAGQG